MLPDEAGSARDAVQVHMFMDDYTLWYSKRKTLEFTIQSTESNTVVTQIQKEIKVHFFFFLRLRIT